MRDCRPDQDLVQRALTGDEDAWRAIYNSTFDRLFSLVSYVVANRDDALDLLQEAYVQAFRHLDRYRGEAPLEAWLRTIALRKALDWRRTVLRRLRRTIQIDDGIAPPAIEEPDVIFDSERLALRRALDRLSSMQRAVLVLHDWEGRSFQETATLLGCKESTTRVHHARARARMQRLLSAYRVIVRKDGLEGQRS